MAEPFRFSLRSITSGSAQDGIDSKVSLPSHRHPICRVFDWQKRLEGEKGLTKLMIGQQEGLSSARITQLFSLLQLPKEGQDYLAALTSPFQIKAFSVRQLRELLQVPASERTEAFLVMKADCERHVRCC